MKQGGRHQPAGFTIVETMIVLAVTAILAASALLLISGRQSKTEFQTSINGLRQQLQQIINETESGYYPNDGAINCSAGTPPRITNSSTPLGTNGGCVFLGKVLYFGPGNADSSFTAFSIAGNRLSSFGQSVTTLAQASPVAIYPGTESPATPNDAVSYPVVDGLSFVGGNNNTTGIPFGIGIVSAIGGSASPSNSGSQQFQLYLISNLGGDASLANVADTISQSGGRNFSAQSSAAQLCIASGTTNQSGLFNITPGLTVSLKIKDGLTCGW